MRDQECFDVTAEMGSAGIIHGYMNNNALALPAEALPSDLLLLEEGRRLIQESRSINEVMQIRDQGEAIRLYMRKRSASIEVVNAAAEIKVLAECRVGELLEAMPKLHGGPSPAMRLHDATSLSDLGIEKTLSHRCQLIARMPPGALDRHIQETKDAGKELTTAGVLRLARSLAEPKGADEPETWHVFEELIRVRDVLRKLSEEWPEDRRDVLGKRIVELGQELIDTGRILA